MLDMIGTLRSYTDAGEADYAISGITYWNDEELQRVLDRHRTDLYRESLYPQESYNGGSVEYRHYYANAKNLEGGTVTYLETSAGGTVAATYALDTARGLFTFTADTGGSVFFLYGRAYDLNAAAADVWRMKAAHFAKAVNFSTDNMKVDRGALQENALRMASHYTSIGGAHNVTITRGDE